MHACTSNWQLQCCMKNYELIYRQPLKNTNYICICICMLLKNTNTLYELVNYLSYYSYLTLFIQYKVIRVCLPTSLAFQKDTTMGRGKSARGGSLGCKYIKVQSRLNRLEIYINNTKATQRELNTGIIGGCAYIYKFTLVFLFSPVYVLPYHHCPYPLTSQLCSQYA